MKVVVPVSGGKDSAVSLVKAINEGHEVYAIFNDTAWEHDITYEYLLYLEKRLNIKIHRTHGGKRGETLVDVIKSVGRFPFGRGRFCTMYLKQYPTRDWYRDKLYKAGQSVQFWYGMRTAESNDRAIKYSGIDESELFDMEDVFPKIYNKKLRKTIKVNLPIVNWSRKEVFKYLKENGIEYNPLYDEGTNNRVGCYPCMLSGQKVHSRMFLTEFGKKRLEIIKGLEVELGEKYEKYDTSSIQQPELFSVEDERTGMCSVCSM